MSSLCLHQLFEAAVDRTPEAVALIDGSLEITYAELERRANQVARHLRRLGVGPETLVGICTARNAGMVAGMLGTLKTGGAYVALDPAYPRERIAFMLEDTAAPVVLTQERLVDGLQGSAALVCLDRDAPVLDAESPERLSAGAGPGSLAYTIYTSGSTGRPKGVAIEHRSAVVLCHWARETFPAGDFAGMLASTSINFDLSVFEIFVPLAWGGTVILAENALALPDLPAAGRVTFINTVPSAIAELVRANGIPPSVRTVGLAGEPLKGVLVERIYARPHIQGVYNLYGPSEDTTYSTWVRIERGAPGEPTIGRPIAETELYLLGPDGLAAAQVPPGEEGEVHLGGAGLARGYLGRPDLTAERFLPDPFSGRPGARLYRVGDLGRLLPDGDVQFLGRVDHQVKIRGFRIELGEIEATLSRHPEVAEAVVMARRAPAGEDGDLRLVAYVEPHPGAAVAAAGLRTYLRERLPAHFVPSVFVPLDPLPRTPNGKVDRKALPEPDWAAAIRDEEAAPPRSGKAAARGPLEEMITEVWEGVLGVPGIEPHQSFFALGGHSLLATQVISRLRDLLRVEVPFRAVFENPTVAGLARVVQEDRRPSTLPPLGPGRFRATGERPPLSFAQQRLWFLDQFAPGSPIYNIPLAERLRGGLSAGLLARVFAEVVRRHEALRTTFAATDGQPAQVIAAAEAPPLPVVDLSGLPEAEREALALRLALEEAWRPFDLEQGPLLRLGLVRLGELDHLLLITINHIVSDGWSLGVLLYEVGALYEAFSQGRPSPLAELPVQYADFAVWQRSWFQGEVLEQQLAYWKRQLAGAPQVLELPTDRPRPAVQTWRGGSRRVALTAARADAVRALCRREGVTPFMALLAAWSVLLGRHAGQEDVLVGSPIAGRTRREIEDLIGFFVNTLVLRIGMEGGTFRELLARVRSTALDAYTHQDLPFERLVEELVPERDLSRAALIQVLFVFQNTPGTGLAIPGVASTPVTLDSNLAKMELDLSLWEGVDGFEGVLGHNADLFDGSTAERLLARFALLLEAAAGDPGVPVAELPLLLPAERQQMLIEWNDAPGAAPREASFPELFRAAARAFPEEPAVISAEGEAWSYRRLDEASDRLARRLRALGVGPDRAVGLCIERSPELILGVVAVLKAGGVYLPLNPAHPDERLDFQLDDTGAGLVLVHAGTRERLPGRRRLEVDPEAPLDEGDGNPLGPVPAEGLAYIIYTSGSTGIPKGVGIPHGAAMVHSATIVEDDALRPGERVVQFSSLSFDVSLEQMLPTLISGAAVVLRGEDLASPAEMLPAFARLGVTSANLPTTYWHQAVQGWTAESAPPEPLRLRVQCVGGEAMLPEAARRWMALAGPLGLRGVRLINGYGPTETVVTATRHTVPDTIPPGASSVPIGRILPHRAAHVIDGRGDLQPMGVLGELCLGGVMARGYGNRPALTAERFVPNPWSSEPGARMYRTGDLVRRLPGGELDYFGRIDRQVKIRGFRIEPGEIEAVLASHPAVAECAVMVREDRPGSRLLAAYLVLDAASQVRDPAAELRSFLSGRLPDYMVPAAFVVLDAFPLTATGKLDRKALPAPERGASEAEGADAPSDPVEQLIAGIWAQVLELDRVGLRDDFFALGGHSLLATQVASRLRTVLGAELPLRKLFEARTVAELARAVRAARQEETAEAPPVTRRPADSLPPLSFGQQRFWFLERLDPGTAVFNIPALYILRGPLQAGALQRTLAEIVRRHEGLRTTISMPDGQSVQLVHPPSAPGLPVVDLSGLPAGLRGRAMERAAELEACRGFDPERGPLVRFLLLRSGAEEHQFLATFHHLITDGLSMAVFERELSVLYEAFSAGLPSPLPELPVQYPDYAVWQRGALTGDHLAGQMAFWRKRLAPPLAALRLPTDHPRPEVPSPRGTTIETRLPRELADAVRELARREGSTLYITLLAAFLALLHRATGQRDLVLGTPVSLRERSNVEDLIGLFVNTLVIRAEVTSGASFRALLAHVRERVLEAFDHRDVPFERLVEELQPERGPNDPPFFQLMFALQAIQEKPLQAGGLELRQLALSTETAQFELTLYMVDTGQDLASQVEYRTGLFDRATIDRMLAAWQSLLEAATANPDLSLADLPIPSWVPEARHAAAPAATAPPAISAVQVDAARDAQLSEMKSQLSDAQKDLLKQRLQRLKRGS